MNVYQKRILALAIGLIIAPEVYATNGDITQLDQEGINIVVKLTSIGENFIEATKKTKVGF